jgi:hypothetical protein
VGGALCRRMVGHSKLNEPYGVLLALRTSGILCGRWVKWVAAVIEEHVLTVVLGRKEVLAPLRCARPALRLGLRLVAASSLRLRLPACSSATSSPAAEKACPSASEWILSRRTFAQKRYFQRFASHTGDKFAELPSSRQHTRHRGTRPLKTKPHFGDAQPESPLAAHAISIPCGLWRAPTPRSARRNTSVRRQVSHSGWQ